MKQLITEPAGHSDPPEAPVATVPAGEPRTTSEPVSRWAPFRSLSTYAEWAALIGLVLLIIVFTSLDSTFLSSGNLSVMLRSSAILIILALGQTFVITTGGIDLSVASVMTFSAVIFGVVFQHGGGFAWSSLAAIAAGTAFGLVNGLIIAFGKITDFVVTLGTFSAASGLALIISDGKPVTIINKSLLTLNNDGIGVLGWSFIIAAALAVIAHVVYFRTRFGTHVLATGGSAEAAAATGISTARIKIAVYVISGFLAGVASVALVAYVSSASPMVDTKYLLNSVAAVVLGGVSLMGGRGSILSPVFGALLLTGLNSGLTLTGVGQYYQPLSVGIVVVLAALLTRFRS